MSSPTSEQVTRKLVQLIEKHGERPVVLEQVATSWGEPEAGPITTVCLRDVPMSAFRIDLLAFDPNGFPYDANEGLFEAGDQIVATRRFVADDLEATVVEVELVGAAGTDPVVIAYLQWRTAGSAARLLVSIAELLDDGDGDGDGEPLTWTELEPMLWAALGRPFPEGWQEP